MTRQVFDIEDYWRVIVFYDVDFHLFSRIIKELVAIDVDTEYIRETYHLLKERKAKAVTFSNADLHTSIILFNSHYCLSDYVDSIVHEAEHVKQALLHVYQVEDSGEPPAYTIGYIVGQMFHVFGEMVCECSRLCVR